MEEGRIANSDCGEMRTEVNKESDKEVESVIESESPIFTFQRDVYQPFEVHVYSDFLEDLSLFDHLQYYGITC